MRESFSLGCVITAVRMTSLSLRRMILLQFMIASFIWNAVSAEKEEQRELLRHTVPGPATENFLKKSRSKDLRCYCNLPSCAAHAYMCRTTRGHCYFELHSGQVALQGCSDADNLDTGCHAHTGRSLRLLTRRPSDSPSRVCCDSQLCNHPSYVARLERRLAGLRSSRSRPRGHKNHDSRSMVSLSSQEVWYRAAVIAVPIAGGCIMIVLVAVAVRLLRADARWRSKHAAAAAGSELLLPARQTGAIVTSSRYPITWTSQSADRDKCGSPVSSVV